MKKAFPRATWVFKRLRGRTMIVVAAYWCGWLNMSAHFHARGIFGREMLDLELGFGPVLISVLED